MGDEFHGRASQSASDHRHGHGLTGEEERQHRTFESQDSRHPGEDRSRNQLQIRQLSSLSDQQTAPHPQVRQCERSGPGGPSVAGPFRRPHEIGHPEGEERGQGGSELGGHLIEESAETVHDDRHHEEGEPQSQQHRLEFWARRRVRPPQFEPDEIGDRHHPHTHLGGPPEPVPFEPQEQSGGGRQDHDDIEGIATKCHHAAADQERSCQGPDDAHRGQNLGPGSNRQPDADHRDHRQLRERSRLVDHAVDPVSGEGGEVETGHPAALEELPIGGASRIHPQSHAQQHHTGHGPCRHARTGTDPVLLDGMAEQENKPEEEESEAETKQILAREEVVPLELRWSGRIARGRLSVRLATETFRKRRRRTATLRFAGGHDGSSMGTGVIVDRKPTRHHRASP